MLPDDSGPRSTPRYLARTVAISDPLPGRPLTDLLPGGTAPADLMSFVRGMDGLVGWGRAADVTTHGPQRFVAAQEWWDEFATRVDLACDEVALPGSGPVAFGSFTYSASSPAGATLIVPSVVVGRRDDHCWLTTVTPVTEGGSPSHPAQPRLDLSETPETPETPGTPGRVVFSPGAITAQDYARAVSVAVERIAQGGIDKAVLARDILAASEHAIDPRFVLSELGREYPRTWVFAVDGLIGATPEMLLRIECGLASSRVLAGTIRRTGDDTHDLALAASLARSSKDLEEHEYAVRSVADALAPHCTSMSVPESPSVLHLPNVMHLATDLAGRLRDGLSPLVLLAEVHPSAAVCGTPRAAADQLIDEVEGMDRGRYAGPVGWMDLRGNADWGLALRCGALDRDDPHRIRLYAGCGIVAGSDPADEVAESEAKLLPMRRALQPG